MITCFIEYVIDENKIQEYEHYAALWISLVNKMGGDHHGYLLPAEGANNIALASFTFISLAKYEQYRTASFKNDECISAFEYARQTLCIKSYQRSFFRPMFK